MKVVILAGGYGSRLSEETEIKAKPMVEIGGRPILWHIMKQYSNCDFNEFILALGYKGESVKRFFADYHALNGSFTVNLVSGEIQRTQRDSEDWIVHLVDTGQDTMTGGRIKRLKPYLAGETFMATYGDGVSDVDLRQLLAFHKSHGKVATITAVRPPARFGGVVFDGNLVSEFTEKPQIGEGWINGGFMVLEPGIFNYITDDTTVLESEVLEQLASERQLAAYRHESFWQCMDTLRDRHLLERLWNERAAPWKTW